MELYIANKNYSTWSLRPWLVITKFGLKFNEHNLKLETKQFFDTLKQLTPTAKVPVLVDGQVTVWESLAICEYINETYLSGKGWPDDSVNRAKARALANEMHSGFTALRNQMPMNIRAQRKLNLDNDALQDIARIEQIWSQQYKAFGQQGGWLFGRWGIVDAMYAPVALRFKTYGIKVNEDATAYMEHVLTCDAIKAWIADALIETEIVQMDEAGEELAK